MKKFFHDDIGKVLEVTGIVLFWLEIAGGLISGIVVGADWGDFGMFAMFFGGGIVGAFITALPLCGFGVLIQHVQDIRGGNGVQAAPKPVNTQKEDDELPDL